MSELPELLRALGIEAAIFFDRDGEQSQEYGNTKELRTRGLFRALFSGPDEVRRMRESLRDQLLPQIWGQGNLNSFVSILPGDRLYALFTTKPLDPVALYQLSKRSAEAVESMAELESRG
jgi:hypothetical protein